MTTINLRQEEYVFRQKLIVEINERINSFINSYFKKYKNNLGYLLIYPLLKLEERCIELEREGKISWIEKERYAISWFVREMFKQGSCGTTYLFDKDEYDKFKKLYPQIKSVWDDYECKLKINDMNSYGQYKVEMIGNKVKVIKPSIMNSMLDASIYYRGIHDEVAMKKESEASVRVINYLASRNHKQLKKIERCEDREYIDLCISRVDRDFEKLGGNIISDSIEQMSNFRKLVGLLYSLSQFKIFCKLAVVPGYNESADSLVFSYNKDQLIDMAYRAIRIPIEQLKKYFLYFTFPIDREGTFQEFPLIFHQDYIYFIPSSFILNDWHLNIPNGHYYKAIDITNRTNTVAHTIVSWVADKAGKCSNIVVQMEKDYQKIAYQQGIKGSEIDLAIYDIDKNILLIIECKWQENVFNPTEDYLNTQRIFNKVYKNQLPVHEQFLINKNNIDYVFDNDKRITELSDRVQIHYLMLDKRVQLHLGNKHLITVYMMLQLITLYSYDGKLHLDELINKIQSFETEVDYELMGACAKFNLEGYEVQAECLNYFYLEP
ncbi:hypothetical protein AB4Z50_13560 [Paenibacillus sp. 2TAB26]|uniref:hypothetical protein n=1 Tax=Paenibacillus sp. 2TAB26 TaxID=3233005 RepID=UPI003F98C930